ncbi:PleD family two-component system response regulator, partial [Saccharopolyspora hordei]|uniref:response regulator n=1 Tax=Saccharopolyspora hordei TaxID=1838 RepID=UPI0035ECE709
MPSKILVVDDLSLSRIILRARLSSACYDTILAPDARTALELARICQPDLVLMDCALPDLDGPDVCKILRADPMTAHIPVILFSANSGRDMRLRALATGADDFLAKPLDEGYLLSRLRALLRRSAVGQELRGHMTPALRAHLLDAVAKSGGG